MHYAAMLIIGLSDVAVRVHHRRRGVFTVIRGDVEREASSALAVGTVVRELLGVIQGERDPISISIDSEGTAARVWRGAGVTGFRLAITRGSIAYTTGIGTFDQAIAQLLEDAPPWPENIPRDAPPIELDPRFSHTKFAGDFDPSARALDLGEVLTRHLNDAGSPAQAWYRAVDALRRLGHDLWSWDDFGDHSIWGWDYVTVRPGAGLKIAASYAPLEPSIVEVEYERRR